MTEDSPKFDGKLVAVAVLAGAVIGYITRLALVNKTANEAIMESAVGLNLFVFIALALFATLLSIQAKLWFFLAPSLFCLMAGVVWIIPLPS